MTNTYGNKGYGNVTGLITWQYNDYVGTKPDVGAKVMLIPLNHKPQEDDNYSMLLFNNAKDSTLYTPSFAA